MFGVTHYGTFVLTVLLFLCSPGPGNLVLITSTSKSGIAGGLAATLGVIAGDQVLMWSAVAGVAALLAAYPAAQHLLQALGAAYLAWLGVGMLLAKPRTSAAPIDAPTSSRAEPTTQPRQLREHPRQHFRQALFITLLNPKAIVFYMAFFPAFADPAQLGVRTYAAMALTIALVTLGYGLCAVGLTHYCAQRIRGHATLARRLEQLVGVVLISFGVKLLVAR